MLTKNVTRYEVLDRDGSDENVAGHPHVDGEWVRYDDIKHLLHDEPRGNVVQLRTTDLSHVSEAIERLLSAMRRGGMGTLASYMDGFHITVEPAKSDAPLHCDPIGDGPLCPKYPDCQCGRSLNRGGK